MYLHFQKCFVIFRAEKKKKNSTSPQLKFAYMKSHSILVTNLGKNTDQRASNIAQQHGKVVSLIPSTKKQKLIRVPVK